MMVLCIWPAPSSPSTGCETGSTLKQDPGSNACGETALAMLANNPGVVGRFKLWTEKNKGGIVGTSPDDLIRMWKEISDETQGILEGSLSAISWNARELDRYFTKYNSFDKSVIIVIKPSSSTAGSAIANHWIIVDGVLSYNNIKYFVVRDPYYGRIMFVPANEMSLFYPLGIAPNNAVITMPSFTVILPE
jgi:hypothetical protein